MQTVIRDAFVVRACRCIYCGWRGRTETSHPEPARKARAILVVDGSVIASAGARC